MAEEPRSELDPPPPLADALTAIARRIAFRGRQELRRAASASRAALERRQAYRDLDQFWIRLGKTSYRLVEEGEVDHVELRRAMQRIDKLQAQLQEMESAEEAGG